MLGVHPNNLISSLLLMDSAKTEKESKSFHSFMSSSESQFKKIKNTKAKLE